MKIGETKSISTSYPTRRERVAAGQYSRAKNLSQSGPRDSVMVMGIPEAELTVKVRGAIISLMEEVDVLRRDLENSHKRIAYLERLADQDTLVPVANRRAFVRELTRVISYNERYNEPSSLVYFDINDFKKINDTYGHGAGDQGLRHVANRLLDEVRESDTVGRLGGDEFGVILWRTDADGVAAKAQELASAIAGQPVLFKEQSFFVSVAFGTATFAAGKSASQLMADADEAMYRNKAGDST